MKLGGLAAVVAAVAMLAAAVTGAAGANAASKRVVWTLAPHACRNQDTAVTTKNLKAAAAAVVCLVNKQRVHWRLPKLTVAPALNRSAQTWTNRMIERDFFNHGRLFQGRITAARYRWNAAGENIATGFRTPAAVVQAWMESSSHCRNILSPYLSQLGTGVRAEGVKAVKSSYSTWTEDFANPYGKPFPSKQAGPVNGCPYNVTIK